MATTTNGPTNSPARPRQVPWVALAVLIMIAGCARYRVGNATLYPPDIHTVYVPIIESNSFRRNLGERLTEAVTKEIELKTPFKVVNTPAADSVLTARIIAETKGIAVESPTDEGRELDINLFVELTWVDRQGTHLQEPQMIPVPAAMVSVAQSAILVPEVGESVATTQQEAIVKMARQIVGLMEAPW